MAPRSSVDPLRATCTTTPAQLDPVNNGITSNGVYGDDDDVISSQHISVSQVPLREAVVVAEAGGRPAVVVTRTVQHLWPF